MSSNTTPVEPGVSAATIEHTVSDRGPRSQFDVERELLCRHIDELEAELARERRRRTRVVDHYERLLERERRERSERTGRGGCGGLLSRLF